MLNKALSTIEAFIDWTGRTVSWLSLALVLVTFTVVVLRYVFDSGSIALQETSSYLHATIFLVGMAYTLQQDAHVRVDIFYTNFSPQQKHGSTCAALYFCCYLLCYLLAWVSWSYIALVAGPYLKARAKPVACPVCLLLKSLILVMTTLLSLQALTQVALNINISFAERYK